MSNKILIWDSSTSDMRQGRLFGGIAVQLNFYAQVFIENGWEVHTLTTQNNYTEDDIIFHNIRHIQSLELFYEWFSINRIIRAVSPKLIIVRGANRLLYPLCIIGHYYKARIIMQGASDVNFIPGQASVGNIINHWLYKKGLRICDFFITQNEFQSSSLMNNFGRKSIVIPNIWGTIASTNNQRTMQKFNVVWVANFRRLKRAEWVIAAARALPNISFALAGAASDPVYFDEIKNDAEGLPNLHMLGAITIQESTDLISNAQILACTSEYEGFPNTFMQAWAADVPVVSTVDPNNLISSFSLGEVISNADEFVSIVKNLLDNRIKYQEMQECIHSYFDKNHSAQMGYEALMNYINE